MPRLAETKFRIHMPWSDAPRMTCSDALCPNRLNGWATVLDPHNAEHAKTATWIKDKSKRRYLELQSLGALRYLDKYGARDGITLTVGLSDLLRRTPKGMLVFLFPPGQECFRHHLDREVTFLHDRYVHTRPRDFNEDHNERRYEFARMKERG